MTVNVETGWHRGLVLVPVLREMNRSGTGIFVCWGFGPGEMDKRNGYYGC